MYNSEFLVYYYKQILLNYSIILLYLLYYLGDGDSSVTKRLNEVLPYGPNFLIQKIECRNHLLRNYCQKLTAAAKKCIYPINVRRYILSNIMRFRTGIVTAIKYRKKENKSTTQQASGFFLLIFLFTINQ